MRRETITMWGILSLTVALIICVGLTLWSSFARADVPREAIRQRAELTRNAQMVWGLNAPVSVFAAQIHQESGWRGDVHSPVGAQGMAQFMPATAAWIASAYPALRSGDPNNPVWAMRAMATYDKYLWDRISAFDDCQRMAMTLSAYNGGLGWLQRDQKTAFSSGLDEPSRMRWFNGIERFNAGRSAAAWRENRDYPRRILLVHQPGYIAAGFGRGVCT